jgi:Flp pilus assembly protein TadB
MNKQISQMNEINARANQQRAASQRNAEISARAAKTAADTAARAREQHLKTAARAHEQFQKNVNNALRANNSAREGVPGGGGKFVLGFLVIGAILFILFVLFVLIVSGLK